MKKKMILLPIICSLFLIGCYYTEEVIDVDTNTVSLKSTSDNNIENIDNTYTPGQTSVTVELPVKGEDFTLLCTYDTDDYDLNNWRITADKSINMSVKTNNLPEGYSAHIEHMHADISLKSTDPQVDGITQDSMDDSDHRIPTKGFPISDEIEYNNTFAIEGYTDTFYKMWGYVCNGYGYTTGQKVRLSEYNLREAGTYAEKLSVVYDVVISTPECKEGYVTSVCSKILIPVTGEVKTIAKDMLGNVVTEDEIVDTENVESFDN